MAVDQFPQEVYNVFSFKLVICTTRTAFFFKFAGSSPRVQKEIHCWWHVANKYLRIVLFHLRFKIGICCRAPYKKHLKHLNLMSMGKTQKNNVKKWFLEIPCWRKHRVWTSHSPNSRSTHQQRLRMAEKAGPLLDKNLEGWHHGRWDAPQDTTQCIWWWTHWAGCTAWTRRCKNVQLGERWFEDRLFFFVNLSFQWFESIFLFILLVGANKPAKRVRGMCNCWSKLGGEFVYQTCCFFSPNGGR